MIHTIVHHPFRNRRTDRVSHARIGSPCGRRRVCLRPTCCLVHQAVEVTSEVVRQMNSGDMSGFKALMEFVPTPWMVALIDGPFSAHLCAQRKAWFVVPEADAPGTVYPWKPEGFRGMGHLQVPQGRIGRSRSHIYALPSSKFRRNSSGNCAIHLSARPPCGATRCPSGHMGLLGKSGRHTTPI